MKKKLPKFISDELMQQLISSIKYPKHRTIFQVMYILGLRLNETLSITIPDINFQTRTILVHGKNDKEGLVPITGALYAIITNHIERYQPTNLLFTDQFNKKYNPRYIREILARYSSQVLPVHVHPHMLRHSCATNMVRHHVNIYHIQQLLRHEDVATTSIYLGCVIDDLRHVMESIAPTTTI